MFSQAFQQEEDDEEHTGSPNSSGNPHNTTSPLQGLHEDVSFSPSGMPSLAMPFLSSHVAPPLQRPHPSSTMPPAERSCPLLPPAEEELSDGGLNAVADDKWSLYEELVAQVEEFLLEIFPSHPSLRVLLLSHNNSSPSVVGTSQPPSLHAPPPHSSTSRRASSVSPTSRMPPTPSRHGTVPLRPSHEEAESYPPPPVVLVKDFPFATTGVHPRSFASAQRLPTASSSTVPSGSLRVEIHFRDDTHEISRHHGLPLFLVVRHTSSVMSDAGTVMRSAPLRATPPSSFDGDSSSLRNLDAPLPSTVVPSAPPPTRSGAPIIPQPPPGLVMGPATALSHHQDPNPARVPDEKRNPATGSVEMSWDEALQVSVAHAQQSTNRFLHSVLWTAAQHVFSPGGPLELDLQYVYHVQEVQQGRGTSLRFPAPFFRDGGASVRLPTVFTPPSTCVPCFVLSPPVLPAPSTKDYILAPQDTISSLFGPSPASWEQNSHGGEGGNARAADSTTSGSSPSTTSGLATTPTAAALSTGWELFHGVSTLHPPLSSFHRHVLYALSSSGHGQYPTALGFSFTPSGTAESSSALELAAHHRLGNPGRIHTETPPPLQPRLVTEYRVVPLASTHSLPPLIRWYPSPGHHAPPPPQSISITSSAFALAGHEMMRYLVELFYLELGPQARCHSWRHGCGWPFVAVSTPVAPPPPVVVSPANAEEGSACCVSIRKRYRLTLYRPPSTAAGAFGWGNNDTTWENRILTYNQILRRRCGSTTYTVGVAPRPVEYLSFTLQWHQLGEEEVLTPGALDPFVFPFSGALQSQQSKAGAFPSPGSSGSSSSSTRGGGSTHHRQNIARLKEIGAAVAEACTIKARAVLRTREACQNKVVAHIQPVLSRYLKILRHAVDLPSDAPPPWRRRRYSILSASTTRTPRPESRKASIPREEERDEEEEETVQLMDTRLAAKKTMHRPDGEPALQAALVLSLLNPTHSGSGAWSVTPMTMLMREEEQQQQRKTRRLLLDSVLAGRNKGTGLPTPVSGGAYRSAQHRHPESETTQKEAHDLQLLLEAVSGCQLPATEPMKGAVGGGGGGGGLFLPSSSTSAALDPAMTRSVATAAVATVMGGGREFSASITGNPTRKAPHGAPALQDIRFGYLPGSFLCRFAFHAGDLLEKCEMEEAEDDGLVALMEMWHMCLHELEELLVSSQTIQQTSHPAPAVVRKKLELLLLLLGLPKQKGQNDDPVDLSQTLLVQKLQLLAYCVRHLHDVAAAATGSSSLTAAAPPTPTTTHPLQMEDTRRLNDEEAENSLVDLETWQAQQLLEDEGEEEEEEEEDMDEEDEGESTRRASPDGVPQTSTPSATPRGRTPSPASGGGGVTPTALPRPRRVVLKLITNHERLVAPPQIPQPPSTSDVLFQQSTLPLTASELEVVPHSKLCSFGVYNDMCLFLYVNQGRVVRFPDFVQWVSPRDFHPPEVEPCNDDNAYLSERMKIPQEEAVWRSTPVSATIHIASQQEEQASERSHSHRRRSDSLGASQQTREGEAALHTTTEELDTPPLPAFASPLDAEDEQNGDRKPPPPPSSSPPFDCRERSVTATAGKQNVWWALWRRATPRAPAQILADSLRHYDQAMELLHWMRHHITPGVLCLELAQATMSNAIHRILSDPRVTDEGTTPPMAPAAAPHPVLSGPTLPGSGSAASSSASLRSFLQHKSSAIFQRLSAVTGLLNMATVPLPHALQRCGATPNTLRLEDFEVSKGALEEAVWEVVDMETAVFAAMELEEAMTREFTSHPPTASGSSHSSNAVTGGASQGSTAGGGPDAAPTSSAASSVASQQVFGECLEAARTMGTPVLAPSSARQEGDRLGLSLATLSLAAWQRGFAPLFERGRERVPLEATVRMSCMAERPAGTCPCFQQLMAHEKASTGSLRLSFSLSKEVL